VISGAYHCANIEAGELVFVADREPDQSAAPIEFRQLRYFLAVAEELHFGRAAARTFISQPALSQSIARLEQTLDVQLLVRNRHRVELTEAGVELVQHARRMLAEREEVVRRLRSVARGEAGVLRVGVALHAEHDVSSALTALAGEHPGLVLDRSSAISERLLEEVRDGKIDAALGYPVPTMAASDESNRRSSGAFATRCSSARRVRWPTVRP
jgi:DNA-binding transcriptional LysR family regulator